MIPADMKVEQMINTDAITNYRKLYPFFNKTLKISTLDDVSESTRTEHYRHTYI